MNMMKKNLLLASLLATTLAVSPSVLADTQKTVKASSTKAMSTPATKQDNANKQAVKNKAQSQANLLEEVNKDVLDGFKKVVEAGRLIAQGKEKEAIKALQDATGKFDIALAANPKLGLVPIEGTVNVSELITTPDAVKGYTSLAIDLLKDSKVQAARAVLQPLRDDMVTRTVYLPMTTYPDAIKLATKLLVDGKKEAALAVLTTALSTFVEKVSVIPLSLVRVEAMVLAASELDKEKEKDKALALLDASEVQLDLAVALGYTDDDSALYEDLKDQIKALKKEIKGGNIVERLYKKLNASIKSLMDKSSKQTETKKGDANKASDAKK